MYRPHAAALLSFLIPGLGQIYNRDILRGLFWLIITPGIWIGSAGLLVGPGMILPETDTWKVPAASSASTRPSFQSHS